MTAARRRRFWGWGWEGEGPAPEQQEAIARLLAARFDVPVPEIAAPPRLEELRLPAPRLQPPAALAALVSDAPHDRAAHTYGKSFRDVVRALRMIFDSSASTCGCSAATSFASLGSFARS